MKLNSGQYPVSRGFGDAFREDSWKIAIFSNGFDLANTNFIL